MFLRLDIETGFETDFETGIETDFETGRVYLGGLGGSLRLVKTETCNHVSYCQIMITLTGLKDPSQRE